MILQHPIVRIILAATFGILLVWKAINPAFLTTRVWSPIPVTWFWVAFFILGWLAAWAVTPAIAMGFNVLAKNAFIPLFVILALLAGIIWLADEVYNLAIASWCTSCPHGSLLATLTQRIFGGT